GLVDEIGMNCIDVRLAKDVAETFHTGQSKSTFEDYVLELIMYSGWYLPKIRGHARPKDVAPRALFDELDLALLDLCRACRVLRRLGKNLVFARRGLLYVAAAELEGDDAVDVLVFGGSAARWDRIARDVCAP